MMEHFVKISGLFDHLPKVSQSYSKTFLNYPLDYISRMASLNIALQRKLLAKLAGMLFEETNEQQLVSCLDFENIAWNHGCIGRD